VPADSYQPIAGIYDIWCAEVTEDVAFYLEACAGASGPIVELGAGTGRISVPLALAGHEVHGYDLSPGMLEQLERRAQAAGVADRIEVTVADVVALERLPMTDRVIAPFRVFLHLHDDATRLAVLRTIAAALRPAGRLVFDVFEPTAADIRSTNDRWIERASGVRERALWDRERRRLLLEVTFRGRSTTMDLAWIRGERWGELLREAGLEVVAAYSDFERTPFRRRPGDSAWIAARPA
jgi:SAM-dependent methyltransferase